MEKLWSFGVFQTWVLEKEKRGSSYIRANTVCSCSTQSGVDSFKLMFVSKGSKLRKSWRLQRRKRKRRRKRSRRRNKKRRSNLRFKTPKWWVQSETLDFISVMLNPKILCLRVCNLHQVMSHNKERRSKRDEKLDKKSQAMEELKAEREKKKNKTGECRLTSLRPGRLRSLVAKSPAVCSSSWTAGQTRAAEDQRGLLRRRGGRGGGRRQILGQERPEFAFIILRRWRVSVIIIFIFHITKIGVLKRISYKSCKPTPNPIQVVSPKHIHIDTHVNRIPKEEKK